MGQQILIAEDEINLLDLLTFNLENEGYQVIKVSHGNEVLPTLVKSNPDLILLDIMMPGKNGFELAGEIKRLHPEKPIIFLTARADDVDRVRGLKSGAVDYITKPFNLEELLLRIKIHLPKKNISTTQVMQIGDVRIDSTKYQAVDNLGNTNEIGKREMALLQFLWENEGKVVSREAIMANVWGNETDITYRTIDNYILSLRKLVNDDPKNPRYIHSVRGIGYKLTL